MSNKGKVYKDRHAGRRLIIYFLRRSTEEQVISMLVTAGYEVMRTPTGTTKKVGKV